MVAALISKKEALLLIFWFWQKFLRKIWIIASSIEETSLYPKKWVVIMKDHHTFIYVGSLSFAVDQRLDRRFRFSSSIQLMGHSGIVIHTTANALHDAEKSTAAIFSMQIRLHRMAARRDPTQGNRHSGFGFAPHMHISF
ncbi:unnamed protein product, partial [Mesorhabditis belari]|uniref:Uncharacterized protein n=1 Tax=Mesorhabditis belari TaxID=2138241 RepID=A0AAF3F8R4_9BILA